MENIFSILLKTFKKQNQFIKYMAQPKMLVDTEKYIECGVDIGMMSKNKDSEKFIKEYKNNGTKIIDIEKINGKINILINFLSKFDVEDILLVGRRYCVINAVKEFSKIVGCDNFTKRYLPGKLTNTKLEDFSEYKVAVICDPYMDKNILNETFKEGVFTIGFCNTDNLINKFDLVIPINNRGKKSVALALYLLAKKFQEIKGKEFNTELENFFDDEDEKKEEKK